YLLPQALYHVGSYPWKASTGALVGRGYKVNLLRKIIYTPKSKALGYDAFLRWMRGNNFMQPSCFFSKTAWEACGPIDESLHFCMDVDLWLKIARKFEFERLEKDIAHAYAHDEAKTTALAIDSRIETTLLIYDNGHKQLAMEEIKRIVNQVAE